MIASETKYFYFSDNNEFFFRRIHCESIASFPDHIKSKWSPAPVLGKTTANAHSSTNINKDMSAHTSYVFCDQMEHFSLDLDCVTKSHRLAMPPGQPFCREAGSHHTAQSTWTGKLHLTTATIWRTEWKISYNFCGYRVHMRLDPAHNISGKLGLVSVFVTWPSHTFC